MRRSKYGNKRIFFMGRWFDSKAEANHYLELVLRQKAGQIRNLQCQVPYELIPKQVVNGKTWPATTYRADFVYDDLTDMRTHVVDVKGKKTEVYSLKKKLMWQVHHIEIEEVTA